MQSNEQPSILRKWNAIAWPRPIRGEIKPKNNNNNIHQIHVHVYECVYVVFVVILNRDRFIFGIFT